MDEEQHGDGNADFGLSMRRLTNHEFEEVGENPREESESPEESGREEDALVL